MTTRNEVVYQLAQDWIRWLDTRRFFGPPGHVNILAQLMKDRRSTREPDGPLDATLAAFNLAVVSQEVGSFIPFVVIYCGYKPRPIKSMACDLGIGRDAFYERAHAAASAIHKTTRHLVRLSEQMRREVIDSV